MLRQVRRLQHMAGAAWSTCIPAAAGARALGPSAGMLGADQGPSRTLRGTNSGSNKSQGCSPSTSQRPSRTPPESRDGGRERAGQETAGAAVLTERDLSARHDVFLQDSGNIVMLEQPGKQPAALLARPA